MEIPNFRELRHGALEMTVCTYGAIVASLRIKESSGKTLDVVLGHDSPQKYMENNSPYLGCVVGRVANRIAGATFDLDGKTHHLSANDGANTLHGGARGLDKHTWKVDEASVKADSICLTTSSPDGDQGFPGEVEFAVRYSLPSATELLIVMEGRPTTATTPISMAHHMYWNLGGHGSGSILDHVLQINATHYTPVGDGLIPTGEIVPVSGTPFDFTKPTRISASIDKVPGGYDHNFVLNGPRKQTLAAKGEEGGLPGTGLEVAWETLREAAVLFSPDSGVTMKLSTNAPGMQFYSGNFLDGSIAGKDGFLYQKHGGLCLETQGFPNAVNTPSYPSTTVQRGTLYRHVMHIRFSTTK